MHTQSGRDSTCESCKLKENGLLCHLSPLAGREFESIKSSRDVYKRQEQACGHGDQKCGEDGVLPGDSLGAGRGPWGTAADGITINLFLLCELKLRGTAVRTKQFGCTEGGATSMAKQVHAP